MPTKTRLTTTPILSRLAGGDSEALLLLRFEPDIYPWKEVEGAVSSLGNAAGGVSVRVDQSTSSLEFDLGSESEAARARLGEFLNAILLRSCAVNARG